MSVLERWRDVAGWEGLYQVSDHGHVRRIGLDVLGRDRTGLLRTDGSKSYVRVQLKSGDRTERLQVHILVLEAFVGPRPEGHEGDHIDRIRANNALTNLRWCTRSQNQKNRDFSRFRRGESTPWAKLVQQQVDEARRQHANGVSCRALARLCDVSEATMAEAISGKTWRGPLV